MKTILSWTLTGTKLSAEYLGLRIYFCMPAGYTMPAPQLLRLAEWLMLSPWHDAPEPDPLPVGAWGSRIGLAFSGGVDSAAALRLLPGAVPVYVERDGIETHLFQPDTQIAFCDEIGAIRVKTNYELIRTKHNLAAGYSTARGMGVPAVLLAEYLGLSGVAYGAVLDDTFFPHGTFRRLTGDWLARQDRFREAGLECLSPTLCCSEVITCRLVEDGPYRALCDSCIRGGCLTCYKCYRKGLVRTGRLHQPGPDVERALAKNPPKMAGPMIWGLQRWGYHVPGMEYSEHLDVSFLERYYPAALGREVVPDAVAAEVRRNLARAFIAPMTAEDVATMQATDLRRPETHE